MALAAPPNPFHVGETTVQDRLGVSSHVMSYAPKVVRPYLPTQHREFYEAQPFLVVAARDNENRMWSTILTHKDGDADLVTSPTSTSLIIRGFPVSGDALHESLKPGSDLGILGIEFATKRRNRVNGRIVASYPESAEDGQKKAGGIEFAVDQSFGNCPQYIKPRKWWSATTKENGSVRNTTPNEISSSVSEELSSKQINDIQNSETLFIATGYRGEGEDPRWGNDASHRGGPKGWVGVKDSRTLLLPDFSGNNHFNSIGNLMLDNRMGVTFPLFETGGMIQLTGTAKVDFDETTAAKFYPGAKRIIEFSIEQIIELPEGSLPIRWSIDNLEEQERTLEVVRKEKESVDVTSFYLEPRAGDRPDLWKFTAGQHLPISIDTDKRSTLDRTYSLSGSADWTGYRISVKREPFGVASSFLHDKIHIGDTIQVHRPAGDFVLEQSTNNDSTLVLVSSGVGITPILSMLHSVVNANQRLAKANRRKVIWVHGARDGAHHPFQEELSELSELGDEFVSTHVAYSRPRESDSGYDSKGRINVDLLEKLVPNLHNADFYMCGTAAFMADIEAGLEGFGVDPKRIKFETF